MVHSVGASKEVEILERRARWFLESAKTNLEKGRYDLACFEAEQAAQLALKALLLRGAGYTPRIHGLRELLGHVATAMELPEAASISRELRDILRRMDDAYFSARYFPTEFEKWEAEKFVQTAQRILDFCERAGQTS